MDDSIIDFINVENFLEDGKNLFKVYCFIGLITNKTSRLGGCFKLERVGFLANNAGEIGKYFIKCLKIINDRRKNKGCNLLDEDERIESIMLVKNIRYLYE